MLEGINELHLNGATLTLAVQHYFDTVLFKEGKSPKVTNIKMVLEASTAKTFIVSIEGYKVNGPSNT